jgi:hypothetical protein
VSTPVIEKLSQTSPKGRKLRHYRTAPAKAIAAARERPASGNQCERIRKLISRWHRDELEAERKAARRKCATASTRCWTFFTIEANCGRCAMRWSAAGDAVVGGTVSKNLDVQGILTEVRSDIECIVMAARQLPPEEGGPIGALADAAGKKIEKALRQLGAEVAASHGAKEG